MKTLILIIVSCFTFSFSSQAQVCVGDSGKVSWEAWRNLYDDEFSELYALENYPLRPDVTQSLYKSQSPYNYDDYYGARIQGFIHVPVTDSVTFNVTGNLKSLFYLSTDENPDNKVLLAYHDDDTNTEDHDLYPEQTSAKVELIAGNYYYFEVIYIDSWGTDFSYLWWKTSFLPTSDWTIITAGYLNDVGCIADLCAERGTPCDDGNSSTTDDQEDGHCHCVGVPIAPDSCIGDRGMVQRFRYDNIPGGNLYDLYENPNYPGMPGFSENLSLFGRSNEGSQSDNGSLVQGYLTVPVTGLYKFNITGDDNVILFLSSDESEENKQAHQALVTGYTGMTQHDKYIWQSTSFILMEAGKYYYMEINQKQGGGSSHFQAFWQTPYSGDIWKRIPAFYVYDYTCDIACIPAGTPCNDGNPFTNDDQYDGNCDCVGTPCSGPDCDSPLASYVPYDKCSLTDQLDNRLENNWLSCSISENPNPDRSDGHWIQYDLGERYQLLQSQVWNYNVMGETDNGFEVVAVDYSEDGSTWYNLGTYNWPLASGDGSYGGFVGPDFSGIFAQYILFSSLDDVETCRGIGKAAFTAIVCPLAGTLCDDYDDSTVNDQYNASCECVGLNLTQNDCAELNVNLGDSTLFSNVYSAIETLNSSSTINGTSIVGFVAGQSITLGTGFETEANTNFIASINPCDPVSEELVLADEEENLPTSYIKAEELTVIPVSGSDQQVISFHIDKPIHVDLYILDENEQIIYTLISHDYQNQGYYHKRIRTKKLNDGKYTIRLVTEDNAEQKPMFVGQSNDSSIEK